MKVKKLLCGVIMLALFMGLVQPVTASAEEAHMCTSVMTPEGYEYAIFPLKCGHFSQLRYTDSSHAGQNAVDWIPLTREGYEDKNATVYAPFTGKIVNDNTSNYGLIVFQSNEKVMFADGTVDIMTVKFGHDNNAGTYKRNVTIKQGEPLCNPGTEGADAYHSHIAVQKGGLGVATPARFPQDKMSRQAKFGTVVESCSKKLPYRPSNHYYNLKRAFWQRYGYIFRKSPLNPYYNGTGISAKGNGKIFEKGCKKSSKSFQTYCLCAAVIGGGLFSCNS